MSFQGLDDTRAWLESQGFRIAAQYGDAYQMNQCNWYAYRRTQLDARECECNDGKPMQIVVRPYSFKRNGIDGASLEIEVCGQFDEWFKLMAYSISPDEAVEKLPQIERKLISAWNALKTG